METDARAELRRRYPKLVRYIPELKDRPLVLEDRVSSQEWRTAGTGNKALRLKVFQTNHAEISRLYDLLYSLYSNEACGHQPIQCWVFDAHFAEVTTLTIDPATRQCCKRDRLEARIHRAAFIVSTWCERYAEHFGIMQPGQLSQIILLEIAR